MKFEINLKEFEGFIIVAHGTQMRSNGKWYFTHPISVKDRLFFDYGIKCPVTLATALGHDLGEDTNKTFEEITAVVGTEVANAIKELTNPAIIDGVKLTFDERLANMLAHARTYSDVAKRVKIADRYDNLCDAIFVWKPPLVKRYAKAGLALLEAMDPIPEDVRKFGQELRRLCLCLE